MDYKEFCQLLSEYYDRELSDEMCREFEKKLRENSRCKLIYRSFRRTVRYLRETEDKKIPDKTRRKIYKSLKIKIEF
ncbi:MAG: anti-sigma factor family protein [Elusimicrobiota bacterium]